MLSFRWNKLFLTTSSCFLLTFRAHQSVATMVQQHSPSSCTSSPFTATFPRHMGLLGHTSSCLCDTPSTSSKWNRKSFKKEPGCSACLHAALFAKTYFTCMEVFPTAFLQQTVYRHCTNFVTLCVNFKEDLQSQGFNVTLSGWKFKKNTVLSHYKLSLCWISKGYLVFIFHYLSFISMPTKH